MPKLMFSPNQLKAIEASGHVIVSAGAGSGKTAVMIERIVRKLTLGYKLDDMLIVTFTRAAAADMRVKLALRLTELKRQGGELSRIASDALNDLPVCNIGTLHSFCQRLIRTYFCAAETDTAATVLDEGDAKRYKLSCIAAAVREMRAHPTPEFDSLCAALSGRRSDDGLIKAVLAAVEFALSLSDPYAYLSRARSDEEYFDALDSMLLKKRNVLAAEAELLIKDVNAAKVAKLAKGALDIVPYLDGLIDKISDTRLQSTGGIEDVLNDRYKALKTECVKYRESAATFARAKTVDSAPYSAVLCSLAEAALKKYSALKNSLARIDYSDLEHGALKALADERCISDMSKRIKLVFIDEYQDVNPLQAEIAARLKSGAGAEMFLVGDIKQSIYAFRRCDPKYFKDALYDPEYTRVELNDNYRSSPAVIEFVNKVFSGVMREDFGGAEYSHCKLVCGKKTTDVGYAEFVEADGDVAPDAPVSENVKAASDAETAEACDDNNGKRVYSVVEAAANARGEVDPQARFIVDSILDYVDGGDRSFSSVAVLVRSVKTAFCDGLIEYMRYCGVPCRLGRSTAVGDCEEARMLLGIMRYIDNRFDDVALYTALRSPMGGFSDAELLEIAEVGEREAVRRGMPPEHGGAKKSYFFWQKADAYKGRLSDRLAAFKNLRDRFTDIAGARDAADVMSAVTSEIDYFQYVFETGGNAAVIEEMIEDAARRKLDLCSYLSVVGEEAELNVSDGGDAVTVSTVHAAKGLEYDYVIVADIGHGFMMREARAPYIVSGDGVAVKVPRESDRTLVESAPWLVASDAIPRSLREEELRLFYVALTRAKNRLTVCASRGKKVHEPTSASSELDYMQNILPQAVVSAEREKAPPPEPIPVDRTIVAAVGEACAYRYPFPSQTVKTCVTALSEGGVESVFCVTDDDRGARYGGGSETDGAAVRTQKAAAVDPAAPDPKIRGTAYHRAMELVDFDDPDESALKSDCENFDVVEFDKIVKAAACVKRMIAGGVALRERPFIVDIPFAEIGGEGSGSVLLQGVIDLLIVYENGDAVIVDYKTSSRETLESEAYKTQLRLYALAVERATCRSARPLKVTHKYLYSFEEDRLIER